MFNSKCDFQDESQVMFTLVMPACLLLPHLDFNGCVWGTTAAQKGNNEVFTLELTPSHPDCHSARSARPSHVKMYSVCKYWLTERVKDIYAIHKGAYMCIQYSIHLLQSTFLTTVGDVMKGSNGNTPNNNGKQLLKLCMTWMALSNNELNKLTAVYPVNRVKVTYLII